MLVLLLCDSVHNRMFGGFTVGCRGVVPGGCCAVRWVGDAGEGACCTLESVVVTRLGCAATAPGILVELLVCRVVPVLVPCSELGVFFLIESTASCNNVEAKSNLPMVMPGSYACNSFAKFLSGEVQHTGHAARKISKQAR